MGWRCVCSASNAASAGVLVPRVGSEAGVSSEVAPASGGKLVAE